MTTPTATHCFRCGADVTQDSRRVERAERAGDWYCGACAPPPVQQSYVDPINTPRSVPGPAAPTLEELIAKRQREDGSRDNETRAATCILLGIAFIAVGSYFLFVEPGVRTEYGEVANLHRLTIGQTLAIMGSVFLAIGIRPR